MQHNEMMSIILFVCPTENIVRLNNGRYLRIVPRIRPRSFLDTLFLQYLLFIILLLLFVSAFCDLFVFVFDILNIFHSGIIYKVYFGVYSGYCFVTIYTCVNEFKSLNGVYYYIVSCNPELEYLDAFKYTRTSPVDQTHKKIYILYYNVYYCFFPLSVR